MTALIAAEQLAELWQISIRTAQRRLAEPGFPSIRIGRRHYVRAEALEAWIKARERPIVSPRRHRRGASR